MGLVVECGILGCEWIVGGCGSGGGGRYGDVLCYCVVGMLDVLVVVIFVGWVIVVVDFVFGMVIVVVVLFFGMLLFVLILFLSVVINCVCVVRCFVLMWVVVFCVCSSCCCVISMFM